MNKIIQLNTKIVVILYLLIDTICVGAGMGLPIFCILFGFLFGWYITKRISMSINYSFLTYSQILKQSLLSASFTFLLMIVIWGRMILMLFDTSFNFKNFGHPFILYDPKISFIGWFILMTVISPFLQLLTTIFASFITLSCTEHCRKE